MMLTHSAAGHRYHARWLNMSPEGQPRPGYSNSPRSRIRSRFSTSSIASRPLSTRTTQRAHARFYIKDVLTKFFSIYYAQYVKDTHPKLSIAKKTVLCIKERLSDSLSYNS